jgi:hypothetical protein
MHLHAIKYHSFDLIGVLIGKKQDQTLIIEDAVPLFHQRFQTGTCEIAFDMIESVYLKNDQQIIGLYEAALPASLTDGREQTQLAQYLCEQISSIPSTIKDSVFIQLKVDMPPLSDDTPISEQLDKTKGLLFKHFSITQNGAI